VITGQVPRYPQVASLCCVVQLEKSALTNIYKKLT